MFARQRGFFTLVSCLGLTLSASPVVGGFVIDGNLDDWGVTVADKNNSVFSSPTPGIGLLGTHLEDQDDRAGHSFTLGPNRGGQDYDAEWMGLALRDSTIYLAIVSGQRPDNGFKYYAPGDIRIETSMGTIGIEVGGGKGGQSGSAISTGAAGATYQLNSNGYTKVYQQADRTQTAGSIWSEASWLLDPIAPKEPVQFEINDSSILLGEADYVFTRDTVTTQHSIIELSFDARLLSGATIESIHWRPACGNDELNIYATVPVPEPPLLVALGLSTLVLIRVRRSA